MIEKQNEENSKKKRMSEKTKKKTDTRGGM